MGDRLQAGKPSWHVAIHPAQLSLAIPPWLGAINTSESWDVYRYTARCTSPVSVVWQCKLVSVNVNVYVNANAHAPTSIVLVYFLVFF